MSRSSDHAEQYEQEHVHDIYEQIASHFSSTRYKPWPIVERFLQSRPRGSVGLDIGCGNGKYLNVNPNIFIVGSDRSSNLVTISTRHQPHSAIVSDILHLPHPLGAFDFAISIAVVHHLSTAERRICAIEQVLDTLKPAGQALIFVWALEQGSSRRGWTEKDEQDVMVPWVTRGAKKSGKSVDGPQANDRQDEGQDRTLNRYYHLYGKGELEKDISSASGIVIESGYERDNWWAIASKATVRGEPDP